MTTYNRIAILGLGLIGSSIARAVKEKKIAEHVAAFDISSQSLDFAINQGFVDSIYLQASQAVENADLIIFATPPQYFSEIMEEIAKNIKPVAIITDVGSVKLSAIADITEYLPEHAQFVPAHPIAGSEKSGVEAGDANLFVGKRVILTPGKANLQSDAVKNVAKFWQLLGTKVNFMPPDMHDLVYAYVSHLPQIVAFAITPDLSINDEIYRKFCRLHNSDAVLWADIIIANQSFVLRSIDDLSVFITQIEGELGENKQETPGSDEKTTLLFSRLIATAIIATIASLEEELGFNPIDFVGLGFYDMTAPAFLNNPQNLLEEISSHNQDIKQRLSVFSEKLNKISFSIANEDKDNLISLISELKSCI